MSTSTIDIIDRGLRCLSDNIGAYETEIFIATILKERFDYTEWRHSLVDNIKCREDMTAFVNESQKTAVFNGNPQVVL